MVKNLIILLSLVIMSFSLHAQNDTWRAWEIEADTLMSQQNFMGAAKLYTNVIDATRLKEKADYKALYKRAVAYYSQADFKNAIIDMDRFIPQFPESYQARILRALCFRESGETDKQLIDVEQALMLSGGDPQILKWRAGLLIEKEEYKQAIEDLLLVRQMQDDAEVELNLGFAYYSLEKRDSALMAINKSIELEPTFLPAYLYGGSFSLEDAQYELAIKYLNIAIMLDPTSANAWFYKGAALIELEKVDEGCSCLRKAFYAGQDDAGDYLKQYCYGIED